MGPHWIRHLVWFAARALWIGVGIARSSQTVAAEFDLLVDWQAPWGPLRWVSHRLPAALGQVDTDTTQVSG